MQGSFTHGGLRYVQEQWVSEFAAQWDDYDWTKQLV